jgi:hypothetical protein
VKPALPDASRDRRRAHTDSKKLLERDDPVLTSGDPRRQPLRLGDFSSHV